jgi:hypothetical protein
MANVLRLCCCALLVLPAATQYQVDSDGKHWTVSKKEEYTFPAGHKPPTPKASKVSEVIPRYMKPRRLLSERCE